MSIPTQPIVKYRVREADVVGRSVPVVLCGRGGSSALVAISNAVLRSYYHLGSALHTEGGMRGRPKYVRAEALQQIIEMAAVERLQKVLNNGIDEAAMVNTWQYLKRVIRLLPECTGVNPVFTSCSTFAGKDDLVHLLDILGLYLYHGLVVDPKEDPDTAQATESKSYDDIAKMLPSEVEDNTALKKFLESTKDGLTASGLRCLKESMQEYGVGILFRINHFSFLTKVGDSLFVLESTEEQINKTPDAVWRVLEEASENGKLLASDFSEIKQPATGHDADELIALQRQDAIVEDEAREKKLKRSKPSSKQRRRHKKNTDINSQLELQQPETVVACDNKTEELKGSKSSDKGREQEEEQEQEVEMEETRGKR